VGEDAVVLDAQARGFPERMKRHNQNGLLLAERLRRHPAVERVLVSKWEFSEAYEAVRRPDGGWGALITFMPKNGDTKSPGIYDPPRFCKGPSLGTCSPSPARSPCWRTTPNWSGRNPAASPATSFASPSAWKTGRPLAAPRTALAVLNAPCSGIGGGGHLPEALCRSLSICSPWRANPGCAVFTDCHSRS